MLIMIQSVNEHIVILIARAVNESLVKYRGIPVTGKDKAWGYSFSKLSYTTNKMTMF